MRARPALVVFLALTACRERARELVTDNSSVNGGDTANVTSAATRSSVAPAVAPPPTPAPQPAFTREPEVALTTATPLPATRIGKGYWTELAPDGVHGVAGGESGRPTRLPEGTPFPIDRVNRATYSPSGKWLLVETVEAGAHTPHGNEFVVLDASTLARRVNVPRALDSAWIGNDAIAFHRDGRVYELKLSVTGDAGGAEPREVGPPSPALSCAVFHNYEGNGPCREGTRVATIAEDLSFVLLVDVAGAPFADATRVRRVSLRDGATTVLLDVRKTGLVELAPSLLGVQVAASESGRDACALGRIRDSEDVALACARDGGPSELVAQWRGSKPGLLFISPRKVLAGGEGDLFVLADLEARTTTHLRLPKGDVGNFFPVPGGRFVIVSHPSRAGLVDLERRVYLPIATASGVIGVASGRSRSGKFVVLDTRPSETDYGAGTLFRIAVP